MLQADALGFRWGGNAAFRANSTCVVVSLPVGLADHADTLGSLQLVAWSAEHLRVCQHRLTA